MADVLIGTFIMFFVMLGMWGVYEASLKWWQETSPMVEAQQIARSTVSLIIYGQVDNALGTDMVGTSTFGRRYGLAWATRYAIPGTQDGISYALEVDGTGVGLPRTFQVGVDAASGQNIVQYVNGLVTTPLRATLGITTLRIRPDPSGAADLIEVTANVTRNVNIGQATVFQVNVSYTDYVFLRNV